MALDKYIKKWFANNSLKINMKLLPKIRINSFKDKKTLLSLLLNFSLLLLVLYPLLNPQKAHATVTEAFVRFDRLGAITSGTISGTACLKTDTSGTETNVVIVFPTGWTINGTPANWTVSTTNLPVDPQGGAVAAWPGIGTATSVSGLSVVFPATDLTVTTTLYCFNFSGTSSSSVAGDSQAGQLKTQGGAPYVDSINYAVSIVAANADQITVTASVSATMSFALSANSIALGTLSTSTTTSGAVTMTVGTNAPDGFVSWIRGTNTTGGSGLRSTVAASTITSPGSFDGVPSDLTVTTGVVIDADATTGSPTISAEYDGNTTDKGGYFDGATVGFHQMANKTGAQTGTVVTINVRAKIPTTQPAATDYTDTLVVVAAGSF